MIRSYASRLELSVLILKETGVWLVLGGQSKEQTQSLSLALSPSVLEEQRQAHKKLFGSDISYQAS